MRAAVVSGTLALMLNGCTDEIWPRPAAIPLERFARELEDWRADRRARLVRPGSGAVTWIGLWPLDPGATTMGADDTLAIVLPAAHSPPLAGTLHRAGADVRFEPAPGANVRLADGAAVNAPLTLVSDRADEPTVLALGSLRFRVHGEPGTDRLWLRGWDEEHPARASFQLPESYPPDTAWRVAARFEPFREPRAYDVVDVADGTLSYRAPGRLVFRLDGREHRLAAFADSNSSDFFVMMWDSTATSATYQAGRYVHVAFPDSTGWTVIDFNRTYNPPCVFTPWSMCAFAPQENRLALAVLAGEKRAR